MRRGKSILIVIISVLTAFTSVYAADPYCQNLGFELGNFTNWVGYTWIYRTDTPSASTPKVQGIINGRQTIMSDTLAYDSNTNWKLRKVPSGSRYSARLGDAVTGALEESLTYRMIIDSTNALLIYKFAVVLQDPLSGHTKLEEPRFKVTLFDQKGDTIPDCANYDVHASDARIGGFQTFVTSTNKTILWRDWTTVGANLLPYIGQTVTVEFMAADCTHQNHFGYAYFVAQCNPMYITVKYCTGDTSAKLTAPDGFLTYKWMDKAGNTVALTRVYDVASPTEGDTFSCLMTSATGCSVTLTSTIAKYEPNADFKYDLVDCNNLTNTMQFSNLYPATHGSLQYSWNFNDGTTSTLKNPSHTFNSSGMHPVSLVVSNPPSTCTDSVSKLVETFYPPMVGISGDTTYCPGNATTLKAYGAFRYRWSTGSTADSINVGEDTTVWLIGYSSAGCYTDTIKYKVKQEPDWLFTLSGKAAFCIGDSTVLVAAGAQKYKWNTGENTSSITVSRPGTYSVTGINARGCEKTISIDVQENLLPDVAFTLSGTTVDTRHNQLTCTAANAPGVQYVWNMGDGNSETGSTIVHNYNVNNALFEYKISLIANDSNGCVNSASKTVDVVPFIPNVFTPNSDGVNDVFVPSMELKVFDRNGMKLYDGNAGWDGMYNGTKMDNDTYFYIITYHDKNKQTQTLKGYVTLQK